MGEWAQEVVLNNEGNIVKEEYHVILTADDASTTGWGNSAGSGI